MPSTAHSFAPCSPQCTLLVAVSLSRHLVLIQVTGNNTATTLIVQGAIGDLIRYMRRLAGAEVPIPRGL